MTTTDRPKFRSIGTRAKRIEGPGKVTGTTVYTADVQLPRMLHAKLVLSPHAHARITSVDATATLAISGVTRVVTAEDLTLGTDRLPPTDGLRYHLDGEFTARVIVRPSGTEPKLKCYLEVVVPVVDASGLTTARERATDILGGVKRDLATAAGI